MIQITGLTKVYRRGVPPAVLDLTFEARPGTVTALLGPEGAGKTTALRLMLELERGRGVTLFAGRTYRRLRRPEREVGVVLAGPGGTTGAADIVGHPGRKARGHLRMLAAAVGVPAQRADELLEQIRLAAVADQRLRTFSPGMHRRLALAAALLGEPATLLLDAPTEGLSPRNVEWFHSFLRSFGAAGGTVLVTTRTPQEAARFADRVITLDEGRMAADQPVAEFRRTRLTPEVAVRGPQMARLADLLTGHGAQVRRDGGAGLAVAGIGRTEIGELAYRHGILLHELADRVVEQPAPRATVPTAVEPARPSKAPAAPEKAAPEAALQQQEAGRTAVADREREPAPALALPAAVATGASAATALSALTARSGDRAVPRRAAAGGKGGKEAARTRDGGPPEEDSSPTVAVDRLFRDGLTNLTRSPDARPGEAADLRTDDTVRLGRVPHRPTELPPAAPRPAGALPAAPRPAEAPPVELRPVGAPSGEQQPVDALPTEAPPAGRRAAEQPSAVHRSVGVPPAGRRAAGGPSVVHGPVGAPPAEAPPVERRSVGVPSGEQQAVEALPREAPSAGHGSLSALSAGRRAAGGLSVPHRSAGAPPAGRPLVEHLSAKALPAEAPPSARQEAEHPSAAYRPAGALPVAHRPVGALPAEVPSAEYRSAGVSPVEQPSAVRRSAGHPAAGALAAERSTADHRPVRHLPAEPLSAPPRPV
ncbi:ATP-binding cassette domain-containing protein, partial [Kitasatospora putterlickiae]|uniref:ATP-binding cassette domain-containing protein n=1 Tax=Kitasatospora putterlickiae TaxID=221725 RepID=UPI0031E1A355